MYHQMISGVRTYPLETMSALHNSLNDDCTLSTEHFRDLVRKPRKGNLKVYMTRVPRPRLFENMVREGKGLLSLGLDAVVALDGERSNVDFPATQLVPPREVSFKKSNFLEMDYEAILRRSPEVVIIDNLLHVNISVSANEMRHHDVRDLLDHGISVITSAYSMFGNNIKNALDYVSGNFPVSLDRWANLPPDEIVALVFSPKVNFHHAEIRTPAGDMST